VFPKKPRVSEAFKGQDYIFDKLVRLTKYSLDGGEEAWLKTSTSERLSVAILLSRPDWLKSMGYSLGGAVQRIGEDWIRRFPRVMEELNLP